VLVLLKVRGGAQLEQQQAEQSVQKRWSQEEEREPWLQLMPSEVHWGSAQHQQLCSIQPHRL
jgi:hypothetical protein